MAKKRCVYKCGAWNCGSYQFNLYKDEIDQGELCDVHYWQTKAQSEQEPVAYYHPKNGFYWAKPTSIFAPTSVEVEPMPLYVKWKAAQRPWQGLTKKDFSAIDQSCLTKLQAVISAESVLKERNT
jgi:hypothetical protein